MTPKVDLQHPAIMPKRRELPVTLDEEGFVIVDPEIGSVHFLNPAAAVVWSCCDGKTTVRQCAYRIRRKFLTPPFADVPKLIRELVTVFLQLNLVETPVNNAARPMNVYH